MTRINNKIKTGLLVAIAAATFGIIGPLGGSNWHTPITKSAGGGYWRTPSQLGGGTWHGTPSQLGGGSWR